MRNLIDRAAWRETRHSRCRASHGQGVLARRRAVDAAAVGQPLAARVPGGEEEDVLLVLQQRLEMRSARGGALVRFVCWSNGSDALSVQAVCGVSYR